MERKIVKIGSHPGVVPGEQSGIEFNDGTFLVDVHYQDCCENVYADWEHLKDEASIFDEDFSNLVIAEVPNQGIKLVGEHYNFFVPCYNEQNGYYNSELNIYLIKPVHRRKRKYDTLLKYDAVETKNDIY